MRKYVAVVAALVLLGSAALGASLLGRPHGQQVRQHVERVVAADLHPHTEPGAQADANGHERAGASADHADGPGPAVSGRKLAATPAANVHPDADGDAYSPDEPIANSRDQPVAHGHAGCGDGYARASTDAHVDANGHDTTRADDPDAHHDRDARNSNPHRDASARHDGTRVDRLDGRDWRVVV